MTSAQHHGVQPHRARRRASHGIARLSARQRWLLTAAGVANALIFLDQTAVVVALHAIQREFHSSTSAVQWTVGAYLLSFAALVAGSGRLADLYGRRRLFVCGVALFALSSAACAAAPSDLVLIVSRVFQGAAAALAQPLVLAHATAAVPAERRGWAIGVVASAGTSCLVIGPVLGGVIVDLLGWRWIFVLNLPLAMFSIAVATRFMPESRAAHPEPLDVPGVILLTTGLAALVAGLLHMQTWATGADLGTLVLGACALGAFVMVEHRSRHPLLPLTRLGKPGMLSSIAALVSIQGSVLGVTVYLVLFLQNGLGLTAIAAGGILILAGMWTPLLSRWTGRIADRQGARQPVGTALLAAAVGLGVLAFSAPAKQVLAIVPGLLIFGISRPFVFTPASARAIKALPASERGLASSLVAEARQFGAVLGVAALGTITAAFNAHGRTGASVAGIRASMLAAAAVSLTVGILIHTGVPAIRSKRRHAAREPAHAGPSQHVVAAQPQPETR